MLNENQMKQTSNHASNAGADTKDRAASKFIGDISIAGQTGSGKTDAAKSVTDKPASKNANDKPVDVALVVFGRDDKRKAHASRFSSENKSVAIKAAYMMGFQSLAVTKTVIRNIAEDLPEGRVFESGKAFVPFVKEGVCLALEGHAKQFPKDVIELPVAEREALDKKKANAQADDATAQAGNKASDEKSDSGEQASADNADQSDKPAKSKPDESWSDIKVGDIVIAVDDPDDGWWEAKVMHVHKSGVGTNTTIIMTLEWVMSPEDGHFTRRANEVAYLHPAYSAEDDSANSYADAKAKS